MGIGVGIGGLYFVWEDSAWVNVNSECNDTMSHIFGRHDWGFGHPK